MGPLLTTAGGVDVGGDHPHDANIPVVQDLDLRDVHHLQERERVPDHHPLVVVDVALGLRQRLLASGVLWVVPLLLLPDAADLPHAQGEVEHVREGDEPEVAPVPLDRGVVLELQDSDLEEPVDVVLHQKRNEHGALGNLQPVPVRDRLPQNGDVRHLLAPAVRAPRPSERRLDLGHGRLEGQQWGARGHVRHEALDGPAPVLHDPPDLVPGLRLRDELPDVLVELAGVLLGQALLDHLQGEQQAHDPRAGQHLNALRDILQGRDIGLAVPGERRRREEALARHPGRVSAASASKPVRVPVPMLDCWSQNG
eukprot:CAMPEP_0168382770 /NCGR_PEP_ID=MMETSP0228-20121227/13563_2 /TAXON_ID=133427 /ORGANISM="Protoceratium reticulatum, Strain CCCM 535 (=CCMP 1889)" /LENGTH=310 /DNA_ID=CAMNT_0008395909 /DNA_START=102 /DNA_END=1032 /DNA_ORIENTATION=-